jgi:hypothetical protein
MTALEGDKKISENNFCLFICAMSSTGFAAALSGSVAIELQEQGQFTGVIGKAYITEQAVEVVTFAEQNGKVVPFAFIYVILEKEYKLDGIYNIKCRNQLAVVSTGTIDLRDRLKPKIALTTDKGITLINISHGGRKMKKEFLPKVDLGR